MILGLLAPGLEETRLLLALALLLDGLNLLQDLGIIH